VTTNRQRTESSATQDRNWATACFIESGSISKPNRRRRGIGRNEETGGSQSDMAEAFPGEEWGEVRCRDKAAKNTVPEAADRGQAKHSSLPHHCRNRFVATASLRPHHCYHSIAGRSSAPGGAPACSSLNHKVLTMVPVVGNLPGLECANRLASSLLGCIPSLRSHTFLIRWQDIHSGARPFGHAPKRPRSQFAISVYPSLPPRNRSACTLPSPTS